MVKGINKQMVVLRLDKNSMYEGACFILKNEAKAKSEADKDMLAEANRIVAGMDMAKRKRGRAPRLKRFFLCTAFLLAGAALGFFVSFLIFA